MRTLLRVSMQVEATNQAISDGSIKEVLDEVFGVIEPEAAYFTTGHGRRTAYVVFDLKDASQIPQIAEPLFQAFNAEIDLRPVMNREDLAKGLEAWAGQRKAA